MKRKLYYSKGKNSRLIKCFFIIIAKIHQHVLYSNCTSHKNYFTKVTTYVKSNWLVLLRLWKSRHIVQCTRTSIHMKQHHHPLPQGFNRNFQTLVVTEKFLTRL